MAEILFILPQHDKVSYVTFNHALICELSAADRKVSSLYLLLGHVCTSCQKTFSPSSIIYFAITVEGCHRLIIKIFCSIYNLQLANDKLSQSKLTAFNAQDGNFVISQSDFLPENCLDLLKKRLQKSASLETINTNLRNKNIHRKT